MLRFAPVRFAIALFTLLVLGVFLAPRPAAAAASTTLTLNSTGPFTVVEGQSITLKFTATNNSGEELDFVSFGAASAVLSGDPSDTILSFLSPLFGCNTIASGGTCTFSITFDTSMPAGTDHDSAVNSVGIGVRGCVVASSCNSASNAFLATDVLFVTVDDPASTATPEPSSLLLLGTGLLGLGPFIRRRLS